MKLFNLRRFVLVLSAVLYLVSCFFDGYWEFAVLILALIGLFSMIVSVVKNSSQTTKMIYAMLVFLILSKLAVIGGLHITSMVFSIVSFVLAIWVIVKTSLYVNKYCTRDSDEHLDEL